MAAAGIVREDCEAAPARTVAILVVLRTDACAQARKQITKKEAKLFILNTGEKELRECGQLKGCEKSFENKGSYKN
jgi:hypothetical protein